MGFDMMASVYRRNKETQKYEKMAFYDKDGNMLQDMFPSRDNMLNQLLVGHNRYGFDFEDIGAHRGLPNWYVDILKEEHPDWFDGSDGWFYNVDEGTYYDYLELHGWAQGDACMFDDWQADPLSVEFDKDGEVISEVAPKRNPLKSFMQQVDMYLNAYGIYRPKPGEIIIVCEMSY